MTYKLICGRFELIELLSLGLLLRSDSCLSLLLTSAVLKSSLLLLDSLKSDFLLHSLLIVPSKALVEGRPSRTLLPRHAALVLSNCLL